MFATDQVNKSAVYVGCADHPISMQLAAVRQAHAPGGLDLLGGTNTVLSVNSLVTNVNCGGVGYSAWVDYPAVLEWIEGFLE